MLKSTNQRMIPLLLCGGYGKRLWPLSRELHPKQMLRLYNAKTLLQNSVLRLEQMPGLERPILACNKKRRFFVNSQIAEINATVSDILLESHSMNTAAIIAYSALFVRQKYGNALLLSMPVDHKIDDLAQLSQALQSARAFAEEGNIVTLGVKPKSPNTQYGYIEAGEKAGDRIYAVTNFREKPNLSSAQSFLRAQHYYWNTGIFVFSVDRILADFAKFHPEILQYCQQALAGSSVEGNQVSIGEALKQCPNISIDYAIMEKTDRIYMVELGSDWTDIGNWRQLYDLDHKDTQGNVAHGNILSLDSKNCYIRGENSLIVSVGMENCFIIQTRDATLIADKDHLDELPSMVKELEEQKRPEATTPATVHRPWGYYTSIESETNFQVKKIVVHPHQRLSLQEHQYRSEHWVILKGKATIVLGHETYTLLANQSTFVPIGVRHQIINNEDTDLELIEVQMGSYLHEDDIKRFDDIYHRDKTDA